MRLSQDFDTKYLLSTDDTCEPITVINAKYWERHHRCRAKVTRGATSRSARSKKLGDNQSQAAGHRSHEDPPVTANEKLGRHHKTAENGRM